MTDTKRHQILLQPINVELTAAPETPLRDLLFEQGVEFPCGGHGRCRGCKVRVLRGTVPVNAAQQEHLSPREIAEGWRLACQCAVTDDLTVELRQWDAAILANDTPFSFIPQEGLGSRRGPGHHHARGAAPGPRQRACPGGSDGAQPPGSPRGRRDEPRGVRRRRRDSASWKR